MPLRLYNTLTQAKEPFQTVEPGKVGMYVCGPTVYSNSHVGHMVGPVIFDTIKRYLVYLGYEVTWVVNITDVDDKLIIQAAKDGTTVKDLADRVTEDYLHCLKALGVVGIDHMPKATEHIDEIVAMTQSLIDKGFAYASAGDVYFDVTKAPEYGKLSHRDPDALQAGARIEPTAIKRNPGDFALWKGSKPGEPAWDSPWGPGRPGWHIECSAMSMKILGEHFDIHGGGLDLVFPHHENEVVQSESYSGKPFATFWLHNGLLTKEGKKISKSDPDTVVLMNDLLKKYDPDTLRALFIASHYRRPTDYGTGRLDELSRGLQAFYSLFERFERYTAFSFYDQRLVMSRAEIDQLKVADETAPPDDTPEYSTWQSQRQFMQPIWEHRQRFLDSMDDDFNTGGALGELYELVRSINRIADFYKLESMGRRSSGDAPFRNSVCVLKELTQILGLFLHPRSKPEGSQDVLTPRLIDLLVKLRTRVRKEKNFALADDIRKELAELGVTLEDRPDGTGWKVN